MIFFLFCRISFWTIQKLLKLNSEIIFSLFVSHNPLSLPNTYSRCPYFSSKDAFIVNIATPFV